MAIANAIPTDDDLRRAYQDTLCRKVTGWPFERAMSNPLVAIAVTNLARERMRRPNRSPESPHQLTLI